MNILRYLTKTSYLNDDPLKPKWDTNDIKLVNMGDTKVSKAVAKQILNLRVNFNKFKLNKSDTPISIIVPYRNRLNHLNKFIPHVSKLLEKIEHEIIVVEQDNNYPFNLGILRNYGAYISKFDQIVHHDVDFLPVDSNYYGCNQPLRLLTNIINENSDDDFQPNAVEASDQKDKVKDSYFSGVISITKEHHLLANGFPNHFFGWGEEDNEFFLRCLKIGLVPLYIENSKFISLPHESNADNIIDANNKTEKLKKYLRKRNGNEFRKSRLGINNYWNSGMNDLQSYIKKEDIKIKQIEGYNYKHAMVDFDFNY